MLWLMHNISGISDGPSMKVMLHQSQLATLANCEKSHVPSIAHHSQYLSNKHRCDSTWLPGVLVACKWCILYCRMESICKEKILSISLLKCKPKLTTLTVKINYNRQRCYMKISILNKYILHYKVSNSIERNNQV